MKKITKILAIVLLSFTSYCESLDKKQLPEPIFEKHPGWIELYWKAWEYAYNNIYEKEGVPASPFMNEGFDPNQIWIWDTCFMVQFCRYAPHIFPGIESLQNFYGPIHDGADSTMRIHIVDNPPLFAWTELEYFRMTGDSARIIDLLKNKQYLQKHYAWFNSVKGNKFSLTGNIVQPNPVNLWQFDKGYVWEGGRSGMDNTPRGHVDAKGNAIKGGRQRPNNPNMLWIDAISQQALSAKSIVNLAQAVHSQKHDMSSIIEEYSKKYEELKKTINSYYWDEEDGIYYDVHRGRLDSKNEIFKKRFMKVKTPASFWAMLAEIPDTKQAERLARLVENPKIFGGERPWVTVARDEPNFVASHGNYWRGGIWLPTAYMGIKALQKYGYHKLATETSYKLIKQMYNTYKGYKPATIWECYSPSSDKPAGNEHGREVRRDFCGWSALGPISLFIENILGFYEIDAQKKVVKWNLHQQGRHGIKNLRFGEIVTDIVFEKGKVSVTSNKPYRLIINGRKYKAKTGKSHFSVEIR